jgi:hypothetical protein
MPELFGPLPRHAVADLPLIVAVVAPWAAAAATAASDAALGTAPPRSRRAGAVVAVGCAVSAIVLAVGLFGALGAAPGLVVAPAWTLARVGSIDAVLGLDLDPARGVVALALAVLGAVHAWRRGGRDAGAAITTAMVVGGGIAAVAADGITTALIGLAIVLAATARAARGARWIASAAALGALWIAGATMAWGLEGRWLRGVSGDYLSDYEPRFAAVRDEPAPAQRPRGAAAAEGRGTLSMTSTPGAEVYTGVADESSMRAKRTPLGVAPFVKAPVPAVLHKIAVAPGGAAVVGGDGLEVALIDAVDVRAGDDVVILPLGATTTWRDVDAQLALRDAEDKHPLRSRLAGKRIAGLAVPTAVVAMLFVVALLSLIDLPRRVARAFAGGGREEAALVAGALAVAAIVPASRAVDLVPLASTVPLLLVAAVVVVAGVVTARAQGPWVGGGLSLVLGAIALVAIAADRGVVAAPLAAASAIATWALTRPGGTAPPRWLGGEVDDQVATDATAVAPAAPSGPAPAAASAVEAPDDEAAPAGDADAKPAAATPPAGKTGGAKSKKAKGRGKAARSWARSASCESPWRPSRSRCRRAPPRRTPSRPSPPPSRRRRHRPVRAAASRCVPPRAARSCACDRSRARSSSDRSR